MATSRLMELLEANPPADEFTPYCHFSREADALTFYFNDTPDYSKRLTDHVTLFLSIETDEVVGCRVKGVSGIIEDLPNYIHTKHDGIQLSIVFLSLHGAMDNGDARQVMNRLGREASERKLVLDPA